MRLALPLSALALLAALLLVLPGQTVTTAYTNDLLVFLDGAHRLASGQVPNRDFHTALGPLVYLIPFAGLWLTGSLGGAMPMGMALVLAAFVPLLVQVLGPRMRPVLALPFGAFLVLLIALPANPGERITALSFAMFYNRLGWAALALLLVMVLRPQQQNLWRDAICAALLVLLPAYVKATYGLAAIGFVCLMLLDPRHRRWAALALALAALGAGAVELVWRGSAGYMADLMTTARISAERGGRDLARIALGNLPTLVLFALIAGLALRRVSALRDLAFYGFCLVSGLLLLSQSAQGWGILTLHAGAAVAAEKAMADGRAPAAGMPLLLAALLLPIGLHNAATLGLHSTLAVARAGEPIGLPHLQEVRFLQLRDPRNPFVDRYLAGLARGGEVLARLQPAAERVVVLDFANPFSAGLGLVPARGDWSWLHWNRNVSEGYHLPGEMLLADADLVLVPEIGINPGPLLALYRPVLDREFRQVLAEDGWTIFRRGEAAP